VTTRPGLRPASPPETLPRHRSVPSRESLRHAAGLAAHAPLPHAPDELPAADAAVAAAWRPASGARVSGTPGLGSTADSSGGPGRRSDTLGAGRSAGRDAGRWSKRPDRDYAQDVPREGLLPKGPPERSAKSLGHFFLMSSPPLDETTAALNLAGPCSPTYRRRRCTRPPARIRLGVIEITGKVHHADETPRGGEGDKEGDGVDLHLRSKERSEGDGEVNHSALLTNSLLALATRTPFPKPSRIAPMPSRDMSRSPWASPTSSATTGSSTATNPKKAALTAKTPTTASSTSKTSPTSRSPRKWPASTPGPSNCTEGSRPVAIVHGGGVSSQ